MTRPGPGIAWMPEPAFARAADPVLHLAPWIEVPLELAFRDLDATTEQVLRAADAKGTLVGHGVHYSPLSQTWTELDREWLARARRAAERFRFRWVGEHFGCLRVPGFTSAPLPMPYAVDLLCVARERMDRLAEALGCPVGLENLALATSADDARRQADFVEALLEPLDGVLVLDLHNLWCAAVNHRMDPVALLERYPLHRARELHLSGGSWSEFPEGRFRRDTHDAAVPEEVWGLLPEAIARCPALEVVVLERLGDTIDEPEEWRGELRRLAAALAEHARAPASRVHVAPPERAPPIAERCAGLQDVLVEALRVETAPPSIRSRALAGAPPGATRWLEGADPRALRTASELTRRWGRELRSGPGAEASRDAERGAR